MKRMHHAMVVEEEKAVVVMKPLFHYAALCKCVLDPRAFDNYLLWRLIYDNKLTKKFHQAINDLDFFNGTEVPIERYGILLYRSADDSVHYFACWPNLSELIHSLIICKVPNQSILNILLSCYLDKKSAPDFQRWLEDTLKNISESNLSLLPNNPPLPPSGSSDSRSSMPPFDPSKPPKILGLDGVDFGSSSAAIALKILGGFIAALGALALVLAFTVLNPPVTAIVASCGGAALLSGIGIFKYADQIPLVANTISPPPQP